MIRKALIINTYNDNKILSLVGKYWVNFLSSNCGGGWEIKNQEEIVLLNNPTSKNIFENISKMKKTDYSIIIFLGNYYYKKDILGLSETIMEINSNEIISEIEINPKNSRCLIIFDKATNQIFYEDMYKHLNKNTITKKNNLKKIYNDYIISCENGCVKIYIDNNKDNIIGTTGLLKIVEKWIINNFGVLTLDELVNFSSIEENREKINLNIRYQGGRRINHFPFAIN